MIKYLDLAIANETIKTTDIKGKDYAEVNERIKVFRMICPNGAIETELLSNNDGMVIMKAIIKDENGKILGTGTAYERENSSFINKTSYIENCETSAVGRALGMLGIGIDTSVASYEEVANAIQNQEVTKEEAEEYVVDFGKYKGKTIKEIYEIDKQYIEWMLGNTNSDRIIKIIELTTGIKIPTPEEQSKRLDLINEILQLSDEVKVDLEKICNKFEVDNLGDMTTEQLNKCYLALKKKKGE